MEKQTKEGESPVHEMVMSPVSKSKAEHEEFCLKMRGPSRKAKYSLATDSEPVPWGKGEKNPGRGVKKNLKPYAYKQSEHYKKCDGVLFVERTGELR